MHLLAIIDDARRRAEGPTLARLLGDLRACGTVITEVHSVPPRPDDEVASLSGGEVLLAPLPPSLMQRTRVRDGLLRNLGRRPPDVVMAFGDRTGVLATTLGEALECPVLAECWKFDHLKRPPIRPSRVAGYVTPSRSLGDAMRSRSMHELIATIPWPIAMPPLSVDPVDAAPSVALLDASVFPAMACTILDGLKLVVEDIPDLQICLELGGSRTDPAWRYAESLGLLDRISSVTDDALMNPLISDCTLVIQSASVCQARSVVDLAMARGRTILRADQPMLTDAQRQTQCILLETSPADWSRTMLDLLGDPDRLARIGLAARAHVEARNDPDLVCSTQTQLLSEVGEALTYPFATAGQRPPMS